MSDDLLGGRRSDDLLEILAARPFDPSNRTECLEQLAPPTRSNARHIVQLRPQIPHGPRSAMEGHREPMRLVANTLQEAERG
jgi:hypothetical protein